MGEESSGHAVQLGRHSNEDLRLDGWSADCISASPKVDSDLPCTQRFDSRSSNFWIGDSEIHMLTHHHACRAAAHGFRPAKFSSRRHACAMPMVSSSGMCGGAQQAECEKEGRGRQHCWEREDPGPGGACGVAPWSLCGAPAARRATGEPCAAAWQGFSRAFLLLLSNFRTIGLFLVKPQRGDFCDPP